LLKYVADVGAPMMNNNNQKQKWWSMNDSFQNFKILITLTPRGVHLKLGVGTT